MKKITGFFLALLPLFIIFLMFISGMIVKQYTHVFVNAVEFAQDSLEIQKVNDDEVYTAQLEARVLPFNASNPHINYYTSNDSVISIDQNGLVTANDFGEAYVYAVSEENETISAECKIEVWDDKIHRIDVRNAIEARYLGEGESILLDAVPVPSTRLKEDPTLSYTSTDSHITVSEDGTVQAKSQTDIGQAAIVNIKTASGKIKKNFEIQIGDGVTSIDLENPADETIKDETYNLFDKILIYPEQNKQKIKPDDFKYTSDNNEIATIDTEGKIKFNQPGTATFTADYLRGDDRLKVSKTLTSTCSYLMDVSFNCYNFDGSLEDYKNHEIPFDKVNWHLYPESAQTNDEMISVTSSAPDIVSVSDNKLLVHDKPGYATITAEYKVPGEETTKKDYCVIHIYDLDAEESFIKDKGTIEINNLCYPLRDNIKTDQLVNENQDVIYTSSDESIATVDQDKELLNFAKAGTVTITASTTGREPETFQVESTAPWQINDLHNPYDEEEKPTITLDVGKIYAFTSDTYSNLWVHWDNEYYKNNFLHGTDEETGKYWFIPKAGGVFNDAIIYCNEYLYDDIYSTVKIIVKQDATPNVIRAKQGFPYYSAFSQTVKTSDVISVYPKTATDELGNPIKPNFTFDEINPQEGWIDDDGETINYIKSANVGVRATYGTTSKDYVIKSTLGSFGKFLLKDPDDGNVIQSGAEYDLTPSVPKTFVLDTSYTHDIQIDPTSPTFDPSDYFAIECNGNNFDMNETKVIYENDQFKFILTPKFEANGSDVIKISSKTFVFYINVTIDPYIHNFSLYYKSSMLKEGNGETDVNVSYTQNLKLDIDIYPLTARDENYTVILNDYDVKSYISSDTIDFTNQNIKDKTYFDGTNNEIIIKSEHGHSETWLLKFLPKPEVIDFTIKEANDDNKVYIPCGSLRCGLTILVDGFVDDEFYEQFSIDNYQPVSGETAVMDKNIKNKIIVRNIATPTERNPGFTNTINVKFTPQTNAEPIAKTFTIDREIISKVVLPKHDNTDILDQKGLQKVHVYGNQSYYNPEEGLIDYYKLPIDIYDYKGSLITNASKKEQAFKQLDVSLTSPNNQANTAWKYKDGYVWIDFDEQSLYTPEEIYDNAFVNGQKNVNIDISTHSGYAHAQYEFVPVKGINAYCKQAIDNDKAIVLQTNFGLEGGAKDNAPFDDERMYTLEGIYGNGYTINFDATSRYVEKVHDDNDIDMAFMFNTTFQGCNDRDIKMSELDIQVNRNFNYPKRFAYNTIKNLAQGLFVYADPQPTYVKNCLFYNNHDISINVNADNDTHVTKMYIENTVMFNCSSAAIDQVLGADIFFKGFVDVYNFKNRDVLSNIMGQDFSFLWDVVAPTIRENHGFQIGADGREYMNSYLLQAQQGDTYFWDGTQYVQSGEGLATAAKNLKHMVDVDIEWPFTAKAGLWGTPNLQTASDAPSYYDQFDKDGNLRWDFLNIQLRKIMRTTNILILR